jgi:DNA-binding transcriptional regulator YhcF (GntR family)
VDADLNWFSLFRALFLQGTVAEIGCSAFTLYCAIKAHTDYHNGTSIPSQKELAEQTGLSERQIQMSLKVLEKHGLLERKKEWKRNVYQLREKIILDNAVATWTYLPAGLKRARQELQNFLLTGDAKDAKVIHIEKLVIENLVIGDQVNVALQEPDLASIKDPRTRTALEKLQKSIRERGLGKLETGFLSRAQGSPAESSPDDTAPDTPPHPQK